MLQINPFPYSIVDFDFEPSKEENFTINGKGMLSILGHPVWFTGREESPEPIEYEWINVLEQLADIFPNIVKDRRDDLEIHDLNKITWDHLNWDFALNNFCTNELDLLYFIRVGSGMFVCSKHIRRVFPYDKVRHDLINFGKRLSWHLEYSKKGDLNLKNNEEERALNAINNWGRVSWNY